MIGHYSQLAHQGISDPSRSMCNGGGGGGGDAKDTRYKNLDRLYGVQTQASQYMLDNAMPHVQGLTNNSAGMVQDAMNGSLAQTMRNRAAYDANEAVGSSNNDAIRNLTKYGAVGDPSGGRFADVVNQNAINSAKTRVGAMNKANQFSEEQKWNRNANFYGQVMGMNNGAMQGMSSAGAGMSGIAGAQASSDQRNAAGYGQAGSAFASALTKADGGYIKAPKLAAGGDAWTAYKNANPVNSSVGGSSGGGRSSGLKQMLGGAAPQLLGASLKDVLKGSNSSMLKAGKGIYDQGKTAVDNVQSANEISDAANIAQQAQALEDARIAADAVTTADAATTATEVGTGLSTLGDSVNTADAAFGTAQTAAEAAAATDVASALPWGFKNGGQVKKFGQKLAMGGMPKLAGLSQSSVANNDVSQDMRLSVMDDQALSKSAKGVSSGATAVAANAPSPESKNAVEQTAKSTVAREGAKAAVSEIAGAGTGATVGTGAGLAAGTGAGITAGAAGTGAGLAAGTGAGITAGAAGTGAGLAAGTGAGVAVGAGGGVAAGAAAGSVVPVVGTAIGAIAGLLASKYLADGGGVEQTNRVDHTAGGEVDGPGTETSDDIPAWLSDGEYVLNAEAVKLVGKDKLEQINDAGLAKRGALGDAVKVSNGTAKAASGGFFGGNMGIALGAGVDEWNRQKANDRADKADLRADAADTRQQATHTAQMDEIQRQKTEREAVGKVWQDVQGVFKGGPDAAAQKLIESYNANDAALGYNDGHKANLKKTDKGYVVTRTGPDGKVADERTFTPQQVQQEHMRSVYSKLAAINPAYGEKLMSFLDGQIKEDTRKGERVEDVTHRDKREGVTDGHWQQNFGLQKQQVANSGFGNAIAQQRLNMAKEEYASGAPDRQLKSTLSTLNLALLNANSEQERAPIAEKITALNKLLHTKNEAMPHYSTVPDGVGGATVVVGDKGGNIATHKIKNGQVVSNAPKPAQQQLPPPIDQRVSGKTMFDHPDKGRLVWTDEGGKMVWKQVSK